MSAFILVFAHRYFATTDDDGRYRIPEVPAGTYTVAVWNEGVGASRGASACRTRPTSRSNFSLGSMTFLRSLTNRIFVAGALLAVVSIGVAIYSVTARSPRRPSASSCAASKRRRR